MATLCNNASFLQLPNEIRWKILMDSLNPTKLRFVLGAADLTNVSNISEELRVLLRPMRTAYLFEKVFDLVKDKVPDKDLLNCRGVCQRWKFVLDRYMEEEGYSGTNKRFNPYHVLGIHYGSSIATIKSAAFQQLRLHHPDKGGSNTKCVQVLKAKEILTNPKYRNLFKNSCLSPFHLKLAWNSFELEVAREISESRDFEPDSESSDSE